MRDARVVLFNNILPPYRVPLFDAMAAELTPPQSFQVVINRLTHPKRRSWSVPNVASQSFRVHRLGCVSVAHKTASFDVTWGTSSLLETLRPTLVIAAGWDQISAWRARAWCRRVGVPFVAWVESNASSGRRRGPITDRIRQAFLKGADAVAVPGRASARYVQGLGYSGALLPLPNSVRPQLASLGGSREAFSFIGELSERKGVDVLLDALPELCRVAPVLIAGDGPLRPQVEAIAREQSAVEFFGPLDDDGIDRLWRRTRVCVLPSRRDPWPLVPVEALTAGANVVISSLVGSAEELEARAPVNVAACDLNPRAIIDAAKKAFYVPGPDHDVRTAFLPDAVAAEFWAGCRQMGLV